MSHPRRLNLTPSSRSSSFSRPKSLVVQVLTRNGKEAESAAHATGSGNGGDGQSMNTSSSHMHASPSSASPSPSPSPSPTPGGRSPASGIPPGSPASGNHMPSPPKTPPGLRIAVPSPGPVGGAARQLKQNINE